MANDDEPTPPPDTPTDPSESDDSAPSAAEPGTGADADQPGDPPADSAAPDPSSWLASGPPALPAPLAPTAALPSAAVASPRSSGRRALPSAYTVVDGNRARVRDPQTVLLEIVATHRGPIPQAELSNRTDLDPSRVSCALSALIDDGRIRKQRFGKTYMVEDVEDPDDEDAEESVAIPTRPDQS